MTMLPGHPHVLRLLGACIQPPLMALVTPYCPKCDLLLSLLYIIAFITFNTVLLLSHACPVWPDITTVDVNPWRDPFRELNSSIYEVTLSLGWREWRCEGGWRLLRRGSLYALLHSPTVQLSWGQVAFICWGAAKGMQHLHSHHVIHRDLKSGKPPCPKPASPCHAKSYYAILKCAVSISNDQHYTHGYTGSRDCLINELSKKHAIE